MKQHIFFPALSVLFIASLLFGITSCGPKTCPEDPSKCPIAEAEVINAFINTDKVLTNTLTGVDYIVDGDIEVNAHLSIEKGVEIQFKNCSSLIIRESGSLTAIGTTSLPVVFTGVEKTKGYWKGLFFSGSNSTSNILKYCTVEYGGCSNADMIIVGDNSGNPARLNIDHASIRDCVHNGLYVANNSFLDAITNSTFSGNDYPIFTHFENPNVKLDNTSTYSNNANNYIFLQGYGPSSNTTPNTVILKNAGIPYYVEGTINVGGNYTISTGVTMLMGANSGIDIGTGGNFTASNVIFQGREATASYWRGVFMSDGVATINGCTMSDGGAAFSINNDTGNQGMFYLWNYWAQPDLKISNTTISNIPIHGISVNDAGGGSVPTISINTGNTITPGTGGEIVHHF